MRVDARARTVDTRLKDVADLFVGKASRLRAKEASIVSDLAGSAAVVTFSNLIPANVFLLGVYLHIIAEITGTVANLDIGDGSDVDLWGAAIGITAGTTTDSDDFTAAASMGTFGIAARDVVLQDDGILLITGGIVRVGAVYLSGSAEIRRRS